MKYFEIEVNGKEFKLRLKSSDAVKLEKKVGKRFLEFIQDYSFTTTVTLLRYLVLSSNPSFSDADASDLYDELVNEGYSNEQIMYDVIYEALVVSGVLDKETLVRIKESYLRARAKRMAQLEDDDLEGAVEELQAEAGK